MVSWMGEDWNFTLYRYVHGSKSNAHWKAYVYIIGVVIIGNFILLQLFLAIRINKFAAATEEAQTMAQEQKKILREKKRL